MNKHFEKLSGYLSSTPVIVGFGTWLLAHTGYLIATSGLTSDTYLSFISELAILIGILILRGDQIQSNRTEKDVKADLRKSDAVLKAVKGKK